MFLLNEWEKRTMTQYNQCLQGTFSSPDIRTFSKFLSVLLSVTSRGHIQNINKRDYFPYSETLLMISGILKNSSTMEASRPDWMGLWVLWRYLCPWQRLGTRWSWRFLLIQIILWFCDFPESFLFKINFLFILFNLLSNSSYSFIDNALITSTGTVML